MVKRLLLYCYFAGSVGLALLTVYLCYALEWRGPFRDLWEFIGLIEQQLNGQWDWSALIEPYGGIHRLLLPKLLFYLDYRFFSGSNLLSLTITLLLHISACLLFIYFISEKYSRQRNDKAILIASTLWFFFSTTQIYNLIYTSDNQVVISNALVVIAAWCFSRYLDTNAVNPKKTVFLYMGNLLIVLACMSHSSGLMLWPALIVMLLLLRLPKKEIAIQVILAAVVFALYVSGHDPLEKSSTTLWDKTIAAILSVLLNMDGIIRYVGFHLSSPTSREWPVIGIIVSYLSISYLISICWRVYQQKWRMDKAEIFWLALALTGFFIAVITACGRQIYPNSALTDRYQTLVMTYWAALLILLYIDIQLFYAGIQKSDTRKPAIPECLIVPIITLLLLMPHQYKNADEMVWLSSRVSAAHTAATTGITDMQTIAATLSHPLLMDKKNLVATHNDFLREHHLGYFSESAARYFYRTTPTSFDTKIETRETCSGKLDSAERIMNNAGVQPFRLSGTGEIDGIAVNEVLVLDQEKKVIGLGRTWRDHADFLPQRWRNTKTTHWTGFINSPTAIQFPLTVIGRTNGNFCVLFETRF